MNERRMMARFNPLRSGALVSSSAPCAADLILVHVSIPFVAGHWFPLHRGGRRRLASAGQARALACFTAEAIGRQTLAFYRQVLEAL